MPDTLPGFLIAAGLVLFVFSLFEGAITAKGISLPSLGRNGRITLMILGPALMIAGGIVYYIGGPLPIQPPPPVEQELVNSSGTFKRVKQTPDCKSAPLTEIVSNQSLLIGLESTTINSQHASLVIVDNSINEEVNKSISVGQSGTYKHGQMLLKITILSVSECGADYEVQKL